jgi:hypothetical protein
LRANRNRGGHRWRSNKFVINAKDTQRCLHFRANKPFSKSAYVRRAKCRRLQFKKVRDNARPRNMTIARRTVDFSEF